jgi:hypothetical protein
VDPAVPTPQPLSEEEAVVLTHLDDVGCALDALSGLGLDPGRLGVVLARLEVRGLAARDHAGYRITNAGARARKRTLDAVRDV